MRRLRPGPRPAARRGAALRGIALLAVGILAFGGLTAGTSLAHDDHGGHEDFPGEGVADGEYKQHDGTEGHLPPVRRNVELVGRAQVTNPSGAGLAGRIADVTAFGDYAYLNAFRAPTCAAGGVHVIDIHDPANPFEVTEAFIPTSPGSYAGEGIQVVRMHNQFFRGDLLVHQNETCDFSRIVDPRLAGGISLWNVSDPAHPRPITLHTGDFTNPAGGIDRSPNQTHSMRVWFNDFDHHTYVVLVDDDEAADVDIMDITDPFHPAMVNDELDLDAVFGVGQAEPSNLRSVFSHDVMVQKVGNRYVMNMNYWDGGYVLLDVTDPRPGHVTLVAESDYAALDEQRLAHGHAISPEGNSHQSELSPNRRFLLGTDEDFDAFRVSAMIDSGPYAGTMFVVTQADGTAPVDADTEITGPTTFLGLACDPAQIPPGTGTALMERGVCPFQTKIDNAVAAGYTAGIVFNSLRPDCMNQLQMAATKDVPYVFVNRLTGLQLLGVPGVTAANACTTAVPAGATGHATAIHGIFDGWGYVRLFGTDVPSQRGAPGSITQLDTYAVPEAQDQAYASGYGDLTVHEVAMDPDDSRTAYISYYSAGFRVVEYGHDGIREVGAFIDEDGNDFWGVEVWRDENDVKYVLASDRDFGLYVLRYQPPTGP